MSQHKKPLTALEEEGLKLHGLPVGTPSQSADAFRNGVSWALNNSSNIAEELAITEHTLSPYLEALLSTWPEHKVIKLLKLKVKLCHGIINSLTLALNGRPPIVPYAYIDDKNRLVKISGHVYFDGGFVDANSEIPDSWTALVEKVGG